MKPKFIDEHSWKTMKPWIFLSTYLILLVYCLWNFGKISGFVGYLIGLFQSLMIGIIFAYILNIPMKQIEQVLIKHTKEKGFLRKRKRAISMTLTFVLAIILIIILGSIV